jgi:hypothetical protein
MRSRENSGYTRDPSIRSAEPWRCRTGGRLCGRGGRHFMPVTSERLPRWEPPLRNRRPTGPDRRRHGRRPPIPGRGKTAGRASHDRFRPSPRRRPAPRSSSADTGLGPVRAVGDAGTACAAGRGLLGCPPAVRGASGGEQVGSASRRRGARLGHRREAEAPRCRCRAGRAGRSRPPSASPGQITASSGNGSARAIRSGPNGERSRLT